MENNNYGISAALVCCGAFISAKLGLCGWLVVMLIICTMTDFATGMAAGAAKGELSSKTGWKGAVKKVGFFVLVGVGLMIDWLISTTLPAMGIQFTTKAAIGSLAAIWLISVELISIVENLQELGVPVPPFLLNIVKAIKGATEQAGDNAVPKDGEHDA